MKIYYKTLPVDLQDENTISSKKISLHPQY